MVLLISAGYVGIVIVAVSATTTMFRARRVNDQAGAQHAHRLLARATLAYGALSALFFVLVGRP